MPTSTSTAVDRYSQGIDPYVQAYREAADAETSVEAQEIMEDVRDEQLSKSAIVDRFEDGYGDAR